MKIIALIPVWHRLNELKLCLCSLSEIPQIEPILIISPGEDRDVIELAQQYRHVWYENKPIGSKLNYGIDQILDIDFDYLMNLGSDNLINPELIDLYNKTTSKFIGIDSFYMVDLNKKRTAIFRFHGIDYSPGAGRMVHKSILLKLRKIYIDRFNSGLDSCSADIIKVRLGISQDILNVKDYPYIIDIKTDQNINSFDSLMRLKERTELFEFYSIIDKFGKAGKQLKLLYND